MAIHPSAVPVPKYTPAIDLMTIDPLDLSSFINLPTWMIGFKTPLSILHLFS